MGTSVSEESTVSILQVYSEPSWKSRRLYTHRGEETTDNLWEWPIRIRNGGKGRRHISQWETSVEIGKEVHLFGKEDCVDVFRS
jgi:hypothetical protein